MTRSYYFSEFIVFCIAFVRIYGDDPCVPNTIENFVLQDDHVLTWEESSTEPCTIDHYLVQIQSSEEYDERLFLTEQTALDLSFLPECTDFMVIVRAVSTDYVQGLPHIYFTKTAAPPEVDLDITTFGLSVSPEGYVTLQWDVNQEWLRCLKQFRFLSYNEDDDEPFTMYVASSSFTLYNIIPCTSYVFTVTALFSLETEGKVSVIRYTSSSAKIDPPSLDRITVGTANVELSWSLPGPSSNRCPVNAIVVDGSPYFNVSYPIPSQNQINRPLINTPLTALQPDTMYMLRVYANNTSGLSEPNIIGIQTRP